MSEKLPEHKVTKGSGEDLCNLFIAENGYNEHEAEIARKAFKHSWLCASRHYNEKCPKKDASKNSDFDDRQKLKQVLYEISDLNEVLRSFLVAANISDVNAGVTVTGCIRDKIQAALDMVEA